MFKRIPGTRDILPDEISWWQEVEAASRGIFSLYNYKEIRLPLIEEAALFDRSLGESAEIVQKQMFLIKKEGSAYALRPEGTASVVRAYLENNLDKTNRFLKLYYIGAMFRMERPQKGRLRQFHHIGAEVIGSGEPCVDTEIISLADRLLGAYKISGYQIKINSLGCAKDKQKLIESLRGALKSKINGLCEDCKDRFKRNVLRILDCKEPSCRKVIEDLSIKDAHLCQDCKTHFTKVKYGLDSLKVGYKLEHSLVRGLDYYTRTVFEITHNELGAQDALGAGGRYDNLVSSLGGPDVGAMGFAFGVERLLLVTTSPRHHVTNGLVYIISLGEEAKKKALALLDTLRKAGITADTDYEEKSLKAALRRANDLRARFVLIIGQDELKKGVVLLKDMASGEQEEIKSENLIQEVKERVKPYVPSF